MKYYAKQYSVTDSFNRDAIERTANGWEIHSVIAGPVEYTTRPDYGAAYQNHIKFTVIWARLEDSEDEI